MADLEETLEKARLEYEAEKEKRISQQRNLLEIAEQKETDLLQQKLRSTENRNLEIEAELSKLKLEHSKEKHNKAEKIRKNRNSRQRARKNK